MLTPSDMIYYAVRAELSLKPGQHIQRRGAKKILQAIAKHTTDAWTAWRAAKTIVKWLDDYDLFKARWGDVL